MKRVLLTFLLLACLFSLGACMFMGAEDRDFYGKGWVNPKDLDRQPTANMPMRPAPENRSSEPLPANVNSSSSDWATPAPHESRR